MVMTDHTSKDYDEALERARELLNVMGARVERQLVDAVECLHTGSPALVAQILRHEAEVNGLERSVYAAKGTDVRHDTPQQIEQVLRS